MISLSADHVTIYTIWPRSASHTTVLCDFLFHASAGGNGYRRLGFATTLVTIGLAMMPAEDEANPVLAVIKVAGLTGLLVAGGTLVYIMGKRRRI
jgi:hypothetical protein